MVPWVLELQSLCNPTFLHELRGKHTPPPPTLANQGESHPLTWPSITSTTLQSSTARSTSVQWRLNFVTRTGVRTGKSQSTRRIQRGRKGSRTVELPHLSPRLLIELTLRGGAVAFVAESQRQPLRTLPQLLRARRSFVQERLCVTGAALLRLPSPPREGLPAQPTPLSQLQNHESAADGGSQRYRSRGRTPSATAARPPGASCNACRACDWMNEAIEWALPATTSRRRFIS